MDPNATLMEIRSLAARILLQEDNPDNDYVNALALAERVQDLDEWLSNGGFFPKDWMPF